MKKSNQLMYNFKHNLSYAINHYIDIALWLIITFLGIRIFETILLNNSFNIPFNINILLNIKGFWNDIVYFGKITFFIFPFFFAFYFYFPKATNISLRIITTLYILISCSLVTFFSIAEIPLDKVIFQYSLPEIIEIMSASQKGKLWNYIIIIGLPIVFFIISKKQICKHIVINTILFLTLLSFSFATTITFDRATNLQSYYIQKNKIVYFIESISFTTKKYSIDKISLTNYISTFQDKFPNNIFINPSYPFLHKETSPDVLSTYFNLQKEKPNFVFIIVEGLGREFSGNNSLLPSATPFLDSLSIQGLSWNNCFSTSQRTICALPSIFGSLPFGKTGFMNYKESAPQFHSLLTILHDNNYHSTFAYGGWLCFDNMCHFLKLNNIDNLIELSSFDSLAPQNTWGIYDDFLFEKTINSINFNLNPRIDVYLTLTTHDPFEYPDEKKYVNQYKKLLNRHHEHPYINEGNIRKIASFLYLDNSIKKLFNLYKNKPNFDNTIFVITGDHNFNMQLDPLVLNNVPLIIWSPMLKKAKQFDGIVSHRDITPSFLALLRNNYLCKTPKNVSWINQGLNTDSIFGSQTFNPIMDIGRDLNCCIYKNILLWNNQVYAINYSNKRLSASSIKDTSFISKFFNAYKNLDLYIMENNALVENWQYENRNNKKTIFSVNTKSEQISFLKKLSNNTTNIKDTICFNNNKFPCTFVQYTITGLEKVLLLELDFNNFIPLKNDSSCIISFVTEIRRDNKNIYWSEELINVNKQGFKIFDKWQNFRTIVNIKPETFHIQKDDEIIFYLWNRNKCKFYISNPHINLSAIFDEK